MEQQILQQKVDSSKQTQAALERQLKENQKQLQELKKNKQNLTEPQNLMYQQNQKQNLQNDGKDESQITQSLDNQQQSLSQQISLNDDQGVNNKVQKVRSHSVSSGNSKNAKKNVNYIKDTNEIEISSFQSSDNSLTVNEKLENANQQIKDLQDYIKKKSLEDIKNNQIKLEATQKMEKLHLEQIEDIKNQMELKDQEKNTIIQNLKDQVKKLESQKRDTLEESKILTPQQLKQLRLMNQDSINDQSIIEPRSEDSFENDINQFSVREIMNNYQCEQCFEKDKIIRINEQKIADYIMQIKQYQMDKISQQQRDQKIDDEQFFENLKNSKIIDLKHIEEQKQMGYNQQKDITTNIQNLHSLLNSSQQILLNNFIRQIKQYLSGVEQCHAVDMQYKMRIILGKLESTQKIKLFDEEEMDESQERSFFSNESLQKRLETKQRLIYMSLDLLNELLILSTKLQTQLVQKQKEVENAQSSESKSQLSQEKVIEKIVEKTVIQFKTIDFGMNNAELKQMQAIAKEERKACHHIIVEIEKLMYEMNSVLAGAQSQTNQAQLIKLAQNVFGQILDTYLLLPHRLKPIFDHCKKIESTISKALKNQDQIIKQQQTIQK